MKDIDYNAIAIRFWTHYGLKLNEWETDFIDGVMNQSFGLTKAQKEVILKMNKKYVTHRQF